MVSVSFPLPRLDSCKAEPLASGPKWQELACCCWGKVESHHLSLTLHFSSSPPIYQIQTMKLWPAGTSPWLPAAPFVPWFSSAPGWGVLILFSCFIINVCAQLEHKPEFGPAPSWNASVASTVSGVLMRPHAGGALRLGFKFEWVCAFVFLPTGFCMNVNIPEAPEISWALPIHRPKPTLGLATFPNVPVQEIFIYFFQNKRKRWGSAQFLPHTPSKPRYVYEPNGTNGRFFFLCLGLDYAAPVGKRLSGGPGFQEEGRSAAPACQTVPASLGFTQWLKMPRYSSSSKDCKLQRELFIVIFSPACAFRNRADTCT